MTTTSKKYHHGNLQQELLDIALAAAQSDGPEAVNLRAIAREAGVSATAVYRHYPSQAALLRGVKEKIAGQMAAHIQTHLTNKLVDETSATSEVLATLQALGVAYIDFSLVEPGLFRTACTAEMADALGPEYLQTNQAFTVLTQLTELLAARKYIAADQVLPSSVTIWASAHGLAVLFADSPLRSLPDEQKQQLMTQTIEVVLRGIKTSE